VRGVSAQSAIFALGTGAHTYLEFDIRDGAGADAVATLASLSEPRTTIGGVNLVVGVRPSLWARLAADDAPDGVEDFDDPVAGTGGFTMPATQHDLWLWVSGAGPDVVFDAARGAISALAGSSTVASEVDGWVYRHDRDLTGFIDGSENPSLTEAPEVVLVPDGRHGAGSAVLLFQRWPHDTDAWEGLPTGDQEQIMGREKESGEELDPRPEDAHNARTDQDELGKIFRRNTPYGGASEHGTVFIGFCARQRPLHTMLRRMAGAEDGTRDALTRYTYPVSGAYYVIPSVEALLRAGGSRS
jgi:putative iron-dependent peroxidase